MIDDKELLELEKKWQEPFRQFTTSTPSVEDSLQLIERIKKDEQVNKPIDLRLPLEESQASQTWKEKILHIFLSQWTFQGMRSWLATGLLMALLTMIIHFNIDEKETGFLLWIKLVTLLMIGVITYVFRSRNEGNDIIERLSYYPLVHQMSARFLIVLVIQLAIAFPFLFFLVGKESILTYLVGTFIPLFFFAVLGFVATGWFGQKIGVGITCVVWGLQLYLEQKSVFLSLFQSSDESHFYLAQGVALCLSFLLLISLRWKFRLVGESQ